MAVIIVVNTCFHFMVNQNLWPTGTTQAAMMLLISTLSWVTYNG